ncbi:MAG TPA: hypothetical protein DIT04_13485 [Dysgonomonas sp.]|nr:hypothetical protein [Dysgonomonas sp.]
MKISSIPTKHILVKANCQSEWDNCDFALITCDDYWKKEFKKKLEAIGSFHAPDSFLSFKFLDCSVEFYQSTEEETETLPEGKDWEFVNLEDGEEDLFAKPENQLDSGLLILYKNGSGFYQTYGKYSGEEYYTYEIPFKVIFEGIL